MSENLSVNDLFDEVDEPTNVEQEDTIPAGTSTEEPIVDEPSTEDEPTEEPKNDDEPADEPSDSLLTGVDRFLADFGVVGGKITFEDGEKVDFNELSPDEQYNVLSSLAEEARPSIEQEYDLEGDEIQLLNEVRKSGKSVNEYLNELVNYNIEKSMALRNFTSTDFENMPDDGIFLRWLAETNPEMSQEEALEKLERQKEDEEIFKSQVNSLRDQFIAAQQRTVHEKTAAEQAKIQEALEADRHEIVATVEYIDNIGGAEITDDMKNEVLHSLLEVNDQGDPLIMEEMFSDPEKLFKAAWLMKYGESYMANIDKYWRRKESEAYKRGQQDVINGAPSSRNRMSRNDTVPKPSNNTPNGGSKGKPQDIDALWD